MSNNYFQFKQFCIHHDRCAMKVGTDGVLLGAWAPFEKPRRILDIGTGSGLIALMMAQRFPQAEVTGIDIDEAAIGQAQENVDSSPFANCIRLSLNSLQDASLEPGSFDAIVCNPPFFEESLLPPDEGRRTARHAATLPFDVLAQRVATLLTPEGRFCVIMPVDNFEAFHHLCFAQGLHLQVRCLVKTSPKKNPKRVMACFGKRDCSHIDERLLVLTDANGRSEQYVSLTSDFYLH